MALTDKAALEALLEGKIVADIDGDGIKLNKEGQLVFADEDYEHDSVFKSLQGRDLPFDYCFSHVRAFVAPAQNKHRVGSWKWARHEFDKNGRNIRNTFGDTRYYRADWKDFDDLCLEGIELRSKCVWSTF